jgi:hypothetical protein
MIYISHRGNINGNNPERENSPEYIIETLNKGYEVEIDIWYVDGWYLGHDKPTYKINLEFLLNDKFWCHAKNIHALLVMKEKNVLKYFWHQNDDFTLTSNGLFWTFPGKDITQHSILVLPELTIKFKDSINFCNGNLYGICSDYIEKYKNNKL